MNLAKISRVICLAQEIIRRAETVETEDPEGYFIGGTKATEALRRTSMELTRALADLRGPG